MPSLNVSVPEDMIVFLDEQAAENGFSSAGDYLLSVVRDAQRRRSKQDLDAKLLEGLQGPGVVMTREDWDALEREALEGLAGEPIGP